MKCRFSRFIGVILLMAVFIASTAFIAMPNQIRVIVNGQEIKPKVQPMLIDDTVMVPVRAIAESLGANVVWDNKANSVIIKSEEKAVREIAAIPEAGIVLSAVETDEGYENFTLEIQGTKRFLDWKSVSNPSYAPVLTLKDINRDGRKELIVILTISTGTGVHVTEAHVINPETMLETYIDNPTAIILKNVKTEINDTEVIISIGDQKTVISRTEIDVEPRQLFSNIAFENICSFEVTNDELVVGMGAQISPAGFIGEVKISYLFKDNMYQNGKIKFERYSN